MSTAPEGRGVDGVDAMVYMVNGDSDTKSEVYEQGRLLPSLRKLPAL